MHIRILLATQVALATATLSSQDLLVDFNSTNQDGGPHPQTGYQAYNAAHEVPADFITRSFPAFGTTNKERTVMQAQLGKAGKKDKAMKDIFCYFCAT